jgi:hypothetical protein
MDARADALEAARASASLIASADSLLVASRPLATLPTGVVDAQSQSELTSLQKSVDRFMPMPRPFLVSYPDEGAMPTETLGWAASVERIAQRQAVSFAHLDAAVRALVRGLSRVAAMVAAGSEEVLAQAPLASGESRSRVQAVAAMAARITDRGTDPTAVLPLYAAAVAALVSSQAEAEAAVAAASAAAAAAAEGAARDSQAPGPRSPSWAVGSEERAYYMCHEGRPPAHPLTGPDGQPWLGLDGQPLVVDPFPCTAIFGDGTSWTYYS